MYRLHTALSLVGMFYIIEESYAGFDRTAQNNLAVYWGQDSYGQLGGSLAQQRLSYYCSNTNIDIIPLAFATAITGPSGQPELNFANQVNNCTTFAGKNLFYCKELEEDIAACQHMYNKTILLSIGGPSYEDYGFSSEIEAQNAARLVWETFGPQQSGSIALRPFGSAAVDGFDFHFESMVSGMAPFAQKLRNLMDSSEDGVHRLLTAAPQCPFPDAADDQFLSGPSGNGEGAVPVDAIFVQFYNNYCGLQSFVDAATQDNFNFDAWDRWVNTLSASKNTKVFLGVPASTGAAKSGYKSAEDLVRVIDYAKGYKTFGGVMIWDVTLAYANGGYVTEVKSKL